jgi:hypothetical protein
MSPRGFDDPVASHASAERRRLGADIFGFKRPLAAIRYDGPRLWKPSRHPWPIPVPHDIEIANDVGDK